MLLKPGGYGLLVFLLQGRQLLWQQWLLLQCWLLAGCLCTTVIPCRRHPLLLLQQRWCRCELLLPHLLLSCLLTAAAAVWRTWCARVSE
jgi:hypothetical protein